MRKNIANKSYILSRLLVYRLYIEKRGKWNERERKIVTVEMKTHFFLEASDLRAICTVDGGARARSGLSHLEPVRRGRTDIILCACISPPPPPNGKSVRRWEFVVRKGMRYPVTGKNFVDFFFSISNKRRSKYYCIPVYILIPKYSDVFSPNHLRVE